MKEKRLKTKNMRGFTLVEMLVAITVLLVGIASPLTIASKGLFAARVARDQMVASYLASEAIDYVRAVRDTNALQGSNWLSGLGPCDTGNGCKIDVVQGNVSGCGGSCDVFNLYQGSYQYAGQGIPTTFQRIIRVDETVSEQEATLSVTVNWQSGFITRSVTMEETLLNWQ